MLVHSNPEEAKRLLEPAREDVKHRWHTYEDLAATLASGGARRAPKPQGTQPLEGHCRSAPHVGATSFPLSVFGRNIVLRNFLARNFGHVGIRRIFHAANHLGLEGLALFSQLFNALRIHIRDVWQSLDITRLPGCTRTKALLSGRG